LGLRYLVWETEHRPEWSGGTGRVYLASSAAGPSRQPWVGALLLIVLLATPFVYSRGGYVAQGVFLLFGVAFGVIFQRPRFGLVVLVMAAWALGATWNEEHRRFSAL